MERLKPPKPIDFDDGNLSEKWKQWKEDLEWYMIATECDGKSEKVRAGILLHCIGSRGKEIYNTFEYAAEGDNLKYPKIVERFEAYCTPVKNLTLHRFKFLSYRQEEGESFDQFVTTLRKFSSSCEFETLKDSLIKDMIIIGTRDKKLQEKLLTKPNITLTQAIDTAHAAEESRKHKKTLNEKSKENVQVDKVIAKGTKDDSKSDVIMKCRYCSYQHQRGKCPAYYKYCSKCNKKGHFMKCCPQKNTRVAAVKRNESSTSGSSTDSEVVDKWIGTVTNESTKSHSDGPQEAINLKINTVNNNWSVELETNGTPVSFKIDTGAEANILPYFEFQRLKNRPKLLSAQVKLTAYNGSSIPIKGRCILHVKQAKKQVPLLFIIADTKSTPILGHESSTKLNLIQRIHQVNKGKNEVPDFVNDYLDCFGKLGSLPGTHHIVTDPNVKPVIHPPRTVPYALLEKLKKELDEMVHLKVIEPVKEPTDWVSSIVIAEKPNGTMRICLDPKELNKAIKRHHFKLPTTEEVIAKMSGSKWYTKLDASNAYWQMTVDEESSKLLTFNTPYGRYRFVRMPYGIHSASELCQTEISRIIENIPGTSNSQDDIIIWASTKEELKKRTIEVLQSCRRNNLKLNKSKCQFHMREVIFLGHKISEKGVHADPKKIEAILNMPNPTSVKDLQRFLGMVNYLSKFIPNLAELTAPLRLLLEKNAVFVLQKPQLEAMSILKEKIVGSGVLNFFNQSLPIRVSSDASTIGLGAVLEQQYEDTWYPVAYASRSLTSAEKNYSQLERETLSIVFACTRFHVYVYGQKFAVFNDHLPLQSIFKRELNKIPARLQRFMLRLQNYNFVMQYIQGSKLIVADTLSRAPLEYNTPEISNEELEIYVHMITSEMPISKSRLNQIVEYTKKDSVSQKLIKYITEGWPQKKKVDMEIRPYYHCRDELVYQNALVIRGTRIVIPKELQKEMRAILHIGHQGIVNIMRRARQTLYWPNMNGELTNMIQSCGSCNEFRNQQPAESKMKHEIPNEPWVKVGTDCFSIKGDHYVILVDYNSSFFEVRHMKDKESSTVVEHTKQILSTHGIPLVMYSDNGPEFTAKEYRQFAIEWDIHHDTSSPEYPESNGKVERTIQTVKKTLKQVRKSNEDPHLAMLTLRTTPVGDNQPSPSQMLFKRQVRSTLPSISDPTLILTRKLKPDPEDLPGYDLPELSTGDIVRFRKNKTWGRMGKVIGKCTQPRSYKIETDKGTIIRRNRRHLLLTKEEFVRESDALSLSNSVEEYEHSPNVENIDREQNDSVDQVPQPNQEAIAITTRSGRTSRPPQYLNDYVL